MMQEEPAYQRFEGTCRKCGESYHYYGSVKRHRDFDVCDECEEKKIVETLTGLKTMPDGTVKGWG